MGENQLAVGATPDVDLHGVGHGGRGQQSTEGVVREPGGPSPVTDDGEGASHHEKLVYK
jgi:hypothetical protein